MSPIDAINYAKKLAPVNPQQTKIILLDTLKQHPEYHEGWALLADTYKKLKEHDEHKHAVKQYEMIFWFNKQLETAKQYLYNQNPRKAEQIIKHLLQLVPNEYRALSTLADIAFEIGDSRACLAITTHNLEANPLKTELLEHYCKALFNDKQFQNLITFYQTSVTSPTPQIESLVAAAYVKMMQFDKAITLYKRLLSKNFHPAQCHLRVGNIEKIRGNNQLAISHFKKAIKLNSKLGEAYWNLANLKTYKFDGNDLDNLEQQVQSTESNLNTAQLHFALAKAYEQQYKFDLAFVELKKANTIQKSLTSYKPSNFTSRCKKHFQERPLSTNKSDDTLQLIFIVSLPRSGSTLVEQILGSHPAVDTSYELTEINAIARELESKKRSDVPYGLDTISEKEKVKYATRYLKFIEPLRGNNNIFIDKQPINFHHIALIKTLFPTAKIIEVTRDKAATAWSLYKHSFAEGHAYSYEFTSLAEYINDYYEIMSHWHALYPNEIFTLDYQNLINEFTNTVDKLLGYCGLSMHENCLSFYKHKRPIMTPSSEQVRQPIYRDALTEWTNYKDHLEPLLRLLR